MSLICFECCSVTFMYFLSGGVCVVCGVLCCCLLFRWFVVHVYVIGVDLFSCVFVVMA